MGRQPLGARPPDRPGRDVRRGRGALRPARRAHRPAPPGRSASPSPTSRSSRSPRPSRSTPRVLIMDEPTAALSGVEVERLFAVARSLRDEGRALVFISHRFDEVFALCDTVTVMRDGDYVATDPIADTDRRRRSCRADGRPRGRRPLPQDAGRRSATSSSRSQGLTVGRRLPRRLLRRCAPARSSAWPASSAPAAARSPAPSSASTATTRARSRLDGRAVPPHSPRAAIKAGHGLRPRGPPQAGPGHRGLRRPQRRRRHPPPARHARACSPRAPRTRAAAPVGRPARGQDRRPRHERRHHERRQPAEGRPRQVAGHQPAAADHRRADPRHRRRHQGRGAPAALRARRPGHGDPDDLLRAARGARHGRPRARRPRGPDHRRARPRRRHPRVRDVRRDRTTRGSADDDTAR